MRKNFTPVSSTSNIRSEQIISTEMNPSGETLKKIMQFAAAYRVEKVPVDRHIEYFLN